MVALITSVFCIFGKQENQNVKKTNKPEQTSLASLFLDQVIFMKKVKVEDEQLYLKAIDQGMIQELLTELEEQIAHDLDITVEKSRTLLTHYHQNVIKKATYKQTLTKEDEENRTYKLQIQGIDIVQIAQGLEAAKTDSEKMDVSKRKVYLYNELDNLIDKAEITKQPVSILLTFKKKDGVWHISTSEFSLLSIYLSFYTGESDIFKLKNIIE